VNTLAVIITTPPYSPLTASAVNYVETALEAGIKLMGVFFLSRWGNAR
jgi:tRNA 2-thiouridine synthesizing protein D